VSLTADQGVVLAEMAACAAVRRAGGGCAMRATDPTRRVDYDGVAPRFDRRYADNDWSGVERALDAIVGGAAGDVLEVGCGTGHWLARLAAQGHRVAGVDASQGMLAKARLTAPGAAIVHGRAEALPWPDARFDRVVCINALHHFGDRDAFLREARRVLRPGGGLLSVGLDPHNGEDTWWIYDWFEPARALDLARYRPTVEIRAALAAAGFARAETFVVMHRPASRTFAQLEAEGRLDKGWTSQLTQLTDAEFAAGVARLRAAAAAVAARGEELVLRADLRLYATTARVDAQRDR
jgi:ubiquinone/menaquinone biosynthesis C-methylase UbiE